MAEDAGSIYSEIRILLTSLDKDIREASTRFAKFDKSVQASTKTASSKVQGLWQSAYIATGLIADRVLRSMFSSFKEAVGVFANFEQSIVNANTVIGGTEEQFQALEEAARRVGETTRLTASQAADALYQLGSAGLNAEQAIAALDGVSALSLATQSDLAESARITTAAVNQFGLKFSDSTRVANAFVASITSTPATMEKLGKAMEYVGPIAGGLNIELEETVGALGALFTAGFTGEKAGRALRRSLIDLADSTSPVNQRLRELGVTYESVNPATNDLASIIGVLADAQIDASNAGAVFGKVSGAQMAVLIREGEESIRAYTDAVTGTNRAFEIAEEQMDTLQGAFDELHSVAQETAITFIGSVAPSLENSADIMKEVLKVLNKLPAPVKAFTIGLTAMTIALGTATVAWQLLSPLFISLLGPAGIIIGGIAAVAGLTSAIISMNNASKDDGLKNLATDMDKIGSSSNQAKEEIIKNNAVIRDISNQYTRLSDVVKQFASTNRDTNQVLKEVSGVTDNLSKKYGITNKELLEMALTTADLNTETRDYISTMLEQIKAQELSDENTRTMIEGHAILAQSIEDAKKKSSNYFKELNADAEEAQASLETTYINSARLYTLLGNSYDSTAERQSAFEKGLRNLVEKGYLTSSDAIQDYIKLNEELRDIYSSTATVTEELTEDQQAVVDAQNKLQSAFQKSAVLVDQLGEEYNSNQERLNAFKSAIGTLTDAGFTRNGEGIKALIELYEKLKKQFSDTAQGTEEIVEWSTIWQDKLRDINTGIEEQITMQKEQEAIEQIVQGQREKGIATFEEVEQRKQDALKKRYDFERDKLQERIDKGEATTSELFALEEAYNIESLQLTEDTEDAKEDAIKQSVELQKQYMRELGEYALDIFNGIGTTIDMFYDNQLTSIDNQIGALEESIDALEDREDDLSAQEQARLAQEIEDLAKLEEERESIEKQQFAANKAIQIANTIIAGARAAVEAWGWAGPAAPIVSASIGALTTAQVALIASQEYPEYATGGIEPSISGGRLVKVAEDGNELMLSDGSKGEALLQSFAQKVAQNMGGGESAVYIKLYTYDERFIGEYITRGSRNGSFTIDPRVVKRR